MKLSPASFESVNVQLDLTYKVEDQEHIINNELVSIQAPFSNNDLQVSYKFSPHTDNKGGYVFEFFIKAIQPVELVHFSANFWVDLQGQRMLANGFQSWSQTKEITCNDRIQPIPSSVAWYTQTNLQGDYDFFKYTGEKGYIHSNSYTHFRDTKNIYTFFGSVSEECGYTYFLGNFKKNRLSIYKDVVGMKLEAGQEVGLVRVFSGQGLDAEAGIWESYSEFFPDRRSVRHDIHVNGWTSWYNYYGDVNEKIIIQNVEALKDNKYPIEIFQIDDGFQTAIGDWLSINEKFPSGMKAVASKIKNAGFKPGLWLAPYAVGFDSCLAKEHPDWLITDPQTGKLVVAGPNWGGFYALDMYCPEACAYLREVFDIVLNDWGFEMLKLDFCFAAAMIPRLGKSRGQIMWEAMDFIRDIVGPEKLILGCGVPLASAFRKVDYCRIGSDVAPWWEDSKLKLLHVRERVSTANSLVSTLNRWVISGRMFGNDPDVMILRDSKNKLTMDERYTLCVLNNILGALVFTSDDVSEYGPDEHKLYRATFPKVIPRIQSVLEFRKDCYEINYSVQRDSRIYYYTTFTNLTDEDQTIHLPESSSENNLLFATDNEMHITKPHLPQPRFYHPSSETKLKTHETKTFMHIPKPATNDLIFLGSTAHIVPGVELDTFKRQWNQEGNDIELSFSKHNHRDHRLYVCLGEYLHLGKTAVPPVCKIDGRQLDHNWIEVEGYGEGREKSYVLVLSIHM